MKKTLQTYTFTQTRTTGLPSETLNMYIGQDKPGGFALVSNISVDTNATKTWISAAVGTNVITLTAHGYATGMACQLSTTGGLPTGLSTSTTYYVIVVDANTVSLATTYAHATATSPTVITFTATGDSGTGTLTPTALAACTVGVQWSIDNLVWNSYSTTAVSASTTFSLEKDRPAWRYVRINFTMTAGSLTVATTLASFSD